MKQTKISINLDGLEAMRREIGGKYRVRVGILGGHDARPSGEPIGNAELGLIQIFGSITNNIPPRDFLVMPIEMKKRELIRVMGGAASRAAFEAGDYRKLFAILGATTVGFVDEAFATGGFGLWPPDKPATVRAKGSSAILIDQAELRKAQSFDIVNKSGSPLSLASPVKP